MRNLFILLLAILMIGSLVQAQTRSYTERATLYITTGANGNATSTKLDSVRTITNSQVDTSEALSLAGVDSLHLGLFFPQDSSHLEVYYNTKIGDYWTTRARSAGTGIAVANLANCPNADSVGTLNPGLAFSFTFIMGGGGVVTDGGQAVRFIFRSPAAGNSASTQPTAMKSRYKVGVLLFKSGK